MFNKSEKSKFRSNCGVVMFDVEEREIFFVWLISSFFCRFWLVLTGENRLYSCYV